jgi:hypothetical protein
LQPRYCASKGDKTVFQEAKKSLRFLDPASSRIELRNQPLLTCDERFGLYDKQFGLVRPRFLFHGA